MNNRNMKRRRPQQSGWKGTLPFLLLSMLPLLQSESMPLKLQPIERRTKTISSSTKAVENRRSKKIISRPPPRQVFYQEYNNDIITPQPKNTIDDGDATERLPIILRPRRSNNQRRFYPRTAKLSVPKLKLISHPSLRSSNEEDEGDGKSPPVFYYDAANRTENALPDVVYDLEGNTISMSELIKTNNDILVEVSESKKIPPPHLPVPIPPYSSDRILPLPTLVPLDDIENKTNGQETNFKPKTNSQPTSSPTTNATTQKRHINPSDWEHIAPESQDQMIIISTVATMALLVGALSARRLRSRPFLSSCIENESLEDELAYDTAYTTDGAGGIFGGGRGYDTFSSVPWKTDLEKFDV